MFDWENDIQKCRNAIRFIDAAKEIIRKEGIENISVRKIAQTAGFHNSTIYLYFKDADYLLLLASLKYFDSYIQKPKKYSDKMAEPKERFLAIWTAFGDTVFEHPKIFQNFFFGKYSEDLTPIITLYYDLFPMEKVKCLKEIEGIYYGKNIEERSYQILKPLIQEKDCCVALDNIELVNRIIISCLKQLLDQKCSSPSPDPKEWNDLLMKMICYVAGIK